ncbi:MAG: diguanylate cyclase [Planctomycetota bacterium]
MNNENDSPVPETEELKTSEPQERGDEGGPSSVEDTARVVRELSESSSSSEFSKIRYFNFIFTNTFKGLALGIICDSYLFGKEYFIYIFTLVYTAYNSIFDQFNAIIENPPSPDILYSNLRDPEMIFIGVLILISCVAFGMWDGWREDRMREYALKDSKRAEKLLETSKKLAQINTALEKLAVTDYLTGLYNRRFAHQQLSQEMARAQRYKDPLTLLLVDIDHFKRINDTYGHAAGDRILIELSRLMTNLLRTIDVPCRYGGEEFLVILPNTSLSQGKVAAKRILTEVAESIFSYEGEDIPVTVSIGLASTEENFPLHFQELIRQADMAMYKAKTAGRNRLCIYSSSAKEEMVEIFSFQPEGRLEELSFRILELRSSLKETAIAAIQSLVNAVGTRDSGMLEHLREVAYHARQIAMNMGMSEEEVETVFRAALLHDIGKLGVPDSILLKKEPLTSFEWRVLEQHPALGARILSPLGFMKAEAAMIKAHHERYDGLGYPEGLKGDEVPTGAYVVALADAYAFMTTRQPYREPKSHVEALGEINKLAGRQFHPDVVLAFMRYAASGDPLKRPNT